MEYKGIWDGSTNTPTLVDGVGNAGDVYNCNIAGTVNFGSGAIAFSVGDFAVYSGSVWQKSINSNEVTLVNGQKGIVILTAADVSDSTNKRYVTDAQLTVIQNTSGTNTGDQTDSTLVFSDITDNNASTLKHGFLPKLSGSPNTFLNGNGSFSIVESGITLGKSIAISAGFILP